MSKASSGDKKTKIPLKWRIKAWWHGYDLEDVKTKLSASEENHSEALDIPKKSPKKPKKSYMDQKDSEEEYHFEEKTIARYPKEDEDDFINQDDSEFEEDDFEFTEDDHVAVKAVWDTERAHVAQVFWGDGYCGPGGPENIIGMTEPLKLNSKRSAMVIGAGLGGPVRAIQKEYNTPVDGYETSERLASDGMDMSVDDGVAQDAPILHLDLENLNEFSRKYDRAYAKESLFIIAKKSQLIQTIYNHLKSDGLFLITDYILSENADESSALFNKWRKLEPYEPRPVPSGVMEACLKDAGFTIRENQDITDFYLGLIAKARRHSHTIITGMEAEDVKDATILKYMHNEAVFWDTRAKLLKRGDLKVIRYIGHKS